MKKFSAKQENFLLGNFDATRYKTIYPDISDALDHGKISTPFDHFRYHGLNEGRMPFRFDSEWYLRFYPLAHEDIKIGKALDAFLHYINFGVGRGYLRHLNAVRPKDPTRQVSDCVQIDQTLGIWCMARMNPG